MAKKKTYIYRLEAGHANNPPKVVEFFYAPNAKKLIQYAQALYKKEKYNKFTAVKVGMTKEPESIRMITALESWYLKKYAKAEFYSERIEP